jgi:cytochrome P450
MGRERKPYVGYRRRPAGRHRLPVQAISRFRRFRRGHAPRLSQRAAEFPSHPLGTRLFQQKDIDHVLQSPALFTNNFGPLLDDFPPEILADQQQSLTFMDPPRHRQHRSLVEYAFRPGAMREREPMMRKLASDILDAVMPRGECEFVGEVAMQLPMRVIYAVLGVREADFAYVADLTNTLALADDPEFAENRQAGFVASL